MKCPSCNGCMNHNRRIVDNKLYLYCPLCKRIWKIEQGYNKVEILGKEKDILLSKINLEVIT